MPLGALEVHDSSARIRHSVEHLSSLGSRVVGYPGCELAADFIETQFRTIGLEDVRREQFDVVVPIDRGARLTLTRTGEHFELQSLWPNEVRTPTLPAAGYEGALVYGGEGLLAQLPAVLAGRVLLMEFNSGRRWLDVAALGVRAVIFIEPEGTSFRQSVEKSASAPLDLPRFWIDRESGLWLRQLIESGQEIAHLTARMDWESRPAWNILGWVGGSDSELGQDTVAVQAYYDASSVVPAIAPGAEASMSVAALLEVARHLQADPPERRVLVLATSAHFQSRQGIGDFLRRHARRHTYYAERLVDPIDIDLFIGLDLSSGSDQLGLWNNTYDIALTRFFAPLARLIVEHGKQVAGALGRDPNRALVNGVSPLKGIGWTSYMPEPIITDGSMVMDAGLPALSLATVLDARLPVGTPLDRVAGVSFPNLYRQVDLLKGVLGRSLSDPGLLDIDPNLYKALPDELRDLRILTQRFQRRNQLPDEAVAGAVVALRRFFFNGGPRQSKGVNPTRMYLTDANGAAYVPMLSVGARLASAYTLDPVTGAIVMAPDLSGRAEAHHGKPTGSGSLRLGVRWSEPVDHTIVLFPTTAQEVYSMVHPGSLTMLRAPKIVDASGVPPRQFGYSLSYDEDELAGVLFGAVRPEEKDRLKILIGGVLLVNSQGSDSEEDARGIGYLPSDGPLTRMGLRSARDMWLLDEYRLEALRAHAIENAALERLHDEARRMIDRATEAEEAGDWERYMASTRAALGVEAKAYPKILSTLNDVIKGIIFFLALLIPAAFFAERLLFAAADIRQQLLGFGGLMLLIWTIMSLVHPAFELAHPLVIVLAFTIMAMAGFVMSLVSSRFNRYMVEYRNRAAGIHTADFSRLGAAYVAFMLGISNMRRRKLRTALTLTTISLLTFSVLSFSSFEDRVRFLSFALDEPADREGVLIRDAGWYRLNPPMLDFAESHFGDSGVVSPRGDILPFDDLGLPTFVEVISGDRRAKARGFLGLAPQEDSISRFGQQLTAGSFFEHSDELTCLLSDEMAADLGIDRTAVGSASIQLLGSSLLVRGIYSSTGVDELRDLDGGTLMPIDFSQSAFATAVGPSTDIEQESGGTGRFDHLAAADVIVLPYETNRSFGGDLKSVAVRFDADDDSRGLIEAFLSRIDTDLYAGLRVNEGERFEAFRYTSLGLTSVRGLGALVIPFLIAVLIILNAMLGAVYERFREIGIYSSVGLAPVHISFLFLAEACVFAVLGVTLGYVVGQASGKILLALDLLHGVELNYSSSAGVTAAVLVMGVVLLSTLYPARVAARLAVPDTVKRWKPSPPDGDEWRFPFPFNISQADAQGACGFLFAWFNAFSGATAGSFYTENVQLSRDLKSEDSETPTWRVEFDMWLSPFDLGVAQKARIEFAPTETPGMYAIDMTLVRSSGEHFHWRRLNPRFFTQLRKQLLIWNTLNAEMRQTHGEAAAAKLENSTSRAADRVEPVAQVVSRDVVVTPSPDSGAPEKRLSPFSMRGIGIGALLSLIIAVGATYATIVMQGTWMTVNASAPAAIFLFVIVTVVINTVLATIGRRFAISQADLVLIYVMMLVAACVPNISYIGYLIPMMAGMLYFDSIEVFRPFVPEWLIIGDTEAVTSFYEGLLPGQTIPWGEWLSPLAHWSALFLALSFMMICMSVILHRQWSTHERLDYPMAQVPMQMIESSSSTARFSHLAPLFHNKWMWIGFAVPFTLGGLEGLHTYYPAVPTLNLSGTGPNPIGFYAPIFESTGGLYFTANYAWIGFSYLVNLDISLSIWVFFLLSKLQDSILSSAAITSTERLSSYAYQTSADPAHQGMGACIVFVLYGLWVGRRHFGDVLRKAWRPDRGIDDSEELISYRTAVVGFLFSLVFVAAWLFDSGMPLVVLPLFLATCLIFYVMITRVIATAGIATARAPMIASFVVISTLGSSIIGAKGIVALALTYPWQSEMRIFPMIACANGLKLAETVRGPKRRLFWAMALALVISVIGATVSFIFLGYSHGAVNLHTGFTGGLAQRPYHDLGFYFLNATYPNVRGLIFTGVGAAVEGFLIAAQHRLHWWPLHPLGFIIGSGWLTHTLWFSVCLAWLLKLIIMKYGGMTGYLATRPFFIGMILGQATAAGLWLVIDGLIGRPTGRWVGYM